MHKTTVTFSERLFRKAKLKATSEGTTVSKVLRILLERWIQGEGKEPIPRGPGRACTRVIRDVARP